MKPELIAPSLLIAGIGVHWTWTYVPLLVRGHRSRHWPSAEGVVTGEYTFDTDAQSDTPGRTAGVKYEYIVDGQRYGASRISHRYAFPFFLGSTIRRVKAPYRTGKRVTVLYDPRNPRRATLESGAGPQNYIAAAISLGVLGWGVLRLSTALLS